jgi:hypothetical protein
VISTSVSSTSAGSVVVVPVSSVVGTAVVVGIVEGSVVVPTCEVGGSLRRVRTITTTETATTTTAAAPAMIHFVVELPRATRAPSLGARAARPTAQCTSGLRRSGTAHVVVSDGSSVRVTVMPR